MDKQERIAKSIERSASDDLHADVREVFPGELEMMLDDNPDLDIDAWADIMRDSNVYNAWRVRRRLEAWVARAGYAVVRWNGGR